mgnify:CR=1 FL=1
MTIDQMIVALEALKERHGDVDVTVWQYGGGLDDLCTVAPRHDAETGTVVLDTEIHDSGQRR